MADEEQQAAPVPDPAWLKLQRLIFGRYVAQQLRQHGVKVEIKDIVEDVKDSVVLVQLAEVLSGKTIPEKLKPAKQRIQQIDNASKMLNFLKNCGIKSSASPEDVVNGNAKFVLGLIFSIIIKYMKLDEDDAGSSDVKEALMVWLKNKTAGYNGIAIENWTKSFHDGLVFCALIHKMRPKLIPYDTLDKAKKIDNLTLALNIAEKYMHVEKYLNPEDIANLDEIGMVVYLYDWYYGVSLLAKQDVAARRIGKLADMTKLHDQMKADYKEGANNMAQWIAAKTTWLSDRTIDNTMSGIRGRLEKFYSYKSKEKAEKIVAHLDLVALFDNLALRLRNNKRPPFTPENDPASLDAKFVELEAAEGAASLFLHTELERQIKLDKMSKRLKAEVDNMKGWIEEKMVYVNATESIDSVDLANYHLEHHATYERDFESARATRVVNIKKIVDELASEKYEFLSEMNSLNSGMLSNFDDMENKAKAKRAVLEKELENQKKINDDLCKAFAAAVKAFTEYMQGLKDKVNDKNAENETLLKFVESSLSNTSQPDSLLSAVDAADQKVQARLITINPYTNITNQDCSAQWNQFKLLLAKKKDLLEAEIANSKRAGLSEEQLREVNDNFDYFDKDKSSFIDRRELRSCLQSLGEDATPADVSNILKMYDKDGDSKISKTEFLDFMKKKLGDSNTQEEILAGFGLLCLDKESISAEHLDAVVNELTFKSHHVEYLKKEMSKLGDGTYDFKKWTGEVFAR